MIVAAAITGPLPKIGVVAVALLAGVALLATDRRARAVGAIGALVLSPVLLLADIWHSPQLRLVHRHPLPALIGGIAAIGVLIALGVLASRRPRLLAPLAILALPFRIPIQAGGATSNLLVPLYLVVAVGTIAAVVPTVKAVRERRRNPVRSRRPEGRHGADPVPEPEHSPFREPPAHGLPRLVEALLAAYVVVYAIQSIYSADFEKALQQMVFFYVPFALLFGLLRRLEWDAPLVRDCLRLVVGLALLFSLIGFVEYATKTIILNPRLVVANDLHTYFTVNSVFFDPDIFGRFLALVMILVAVALLYERRERREQLIAVGVLAVLWACLVLTLSRSSLGALLVGLAVLAALRYRPSRALVAAIVVVVIGAAAVAATPTTFGLNQGINGASSGRGGLVSGGVGLFGDRPVWGWGSGSFVTEYRRHHRHQATTLSASHTIPVTIAAEQGLIGEVVYVALVLAALVCLLRRSRGDPVRSALGAAFAALVFHTMLYADFLEDPTTWALLGIGVPMAIAAGVHGHPHLRSRAPHARQERPPAPAATA